MKLCFPAHLTNPAEELALADLALTHFASPVAKSGSRRCYARCRWNWQLLEVNTVPGMTSHSLVPPVAAGPVPVELLSEIYLHSMGARHAQLKTASKRVSGGSVDRAAAISGSDAGSIVVCWGPARRCRVRTQGAAYLAPSKSNA